MATTLWGKKIGMTQLFSQDKVVPVTAIDLGRWVLTQIKTVDSDGYTAVQVGCVKERFQPEEFKADWLKKPHQYFQVLKEVEFDSFPEGLQIGALLPWALTVGSKVDIAGITKGHGFQGAMKRHDFSGAPASHGGGFGRRPGSSGFIRTQGKIIKGKRFPGHMGVKRRTVQGLEVIKVDNESNIALVKGSVPGKAGSFLFIRA